MLQFPWTTLCTLLSLYFFLVYERNDSITESIVYLQTRRENILLVLQTKFPAKYPRKNKTWQLVAGGRKVGCLLKSLSTGEVSQRDLAVLMKYGNVIPATDDIYQKKKILRNL